MGRLVLLLAAIVGGSGVTDEEMKALAGLRKVDATITVDEKLPGRPVVAVNL